ncbi:trypsin-like peptidase domain-containing protein [Pedobacter frigoris]|uniref:trypsin-like peptidase domain-containing protein n=1 Tax=Pedobacter frigoris TaxID=2571272 RepID=UPI00292E095F|nr:trypsin-like peptidase domain-containing protein [Pedobacter frigoris]
MINKLTIIGIGFLFWALPNSAQEVKKTKEIEKVIDKVIDRAYNTTVQIARFDTVSKKALPGIFSGTVVTKEGHILTAAHATQPDMWYEIMFPNGDRYMAKGYGRISIGGFSARGNSTSLDAAMLKITGSGTWNFAEMGESSTMKVGELCVSIASPATFKNGKPNIRLGRLTKVNFQSGFIESTCKMEPGDSGGALFNSEGKLIGVHSYINGGEEVNLEVPVYYFKKYWSALNIAKDYKSLPDSNKLEQEVKSSNVVTILPIQELTKLTKKALESAVTVSSLVGDKASSIVGTLITYAKLSKTKTYVVSKSSMVGVEPKVMLDAVDRPAAVIARDIENDLVLLEVDAATSSNSVKINLGTDTLAMQFANLGDLVISAKGKGQQYISVLSTNFIDVPRGIGYFGAGANFIDKKITITSIMPRGSADGILMLKDVITGINGHPISQPQEYGEQVNKYFAGDTITVELLRDGKEMQVKFYYIPFRMNHIAERFAGGHSTKSDGYKKVLVHDGAIRADECGSPVFNGKGEFYGINIARVSRTSTLMLPYDMIRSFLDKSMRSI